MRAPALLADPRRIVHGLVRRHRRPLAAALAAAGVLLALASVRGAVAEPARTVDGSLPAPADPATLRPGEVGVPVALATDGVASLLAVGDVLDLIAVDDDGPRVVASSARVVSLPATGGGLSASSGDLVVVAVPDARAREVAVAGAEGGIVVVLRAATARR